MKSPASSLVHAGRELARWGMIGVAVCAVGAFGLSSRAASPRPPAPSTKKNDPSAVAAPRLSPLTLDPYASQDPLVTFHQWRMKNRVSLPVIPAVMSAHREWLRYHDAGTAQGGSAPVGAGSPTVGTNLCPAGGVPGYQGEVSIAVNPNNPQELVAGANTFYQDPASGCQAPSGSTYGTQALYGSSDGGQTWTYNCAPWPADDVGSVGPVFFGSDPSMAWDTNGTAYAAYMLISQTSSGSSSSSSIVMAESTDAGASWTPLGYVIDNLNNSSLFEDKDMMAVDTTVGGAHSYTNRLYVIWDENNTERVAYSDSGTSGSWTIVPVEDSADAGNDIGGDVAVGPDGTVYAIWDRLPTSGDTHVFAKSTDGGQTWSAPVQIASGTLSSFGSNNTPPAQNKRGINAFGAIAVDTGSSPYSGTIYVVYPDFPSGVSSGTDVNIYEIHSSDGGSTWTTPVKVNDDTGTATQFFPWVAVDPASGDVVVSWYDTRNDPNNKQTQIFFAYSTDGGKTFSSNLQVTQASSQFSSQNAAIVYSDENSTDNTNYNPNQYGDYAQITAQSGKAWVIWTDSRQFFPYDTSNTKVEDAAVAAVTLCTAPGIPTGLSATVPGNNQIGLSWSAGNPAGSTYNVYRAYGSCASPGTFSLLAMGVSGTSYTDSTVSGGTTYAYEVTAVDSTGGCESGLSACASTTATGSCTLPPTFGGLTSLTNPQGSTCELDLAWNAATPNCGTSVTYNVYRSTSASFVPSASSMIATGVVGTSYSDTSGLASGTLYYYIVRAVDASTGVEDANTVERSALVSGAFSSATFKDNVENGILPQVTQQDANWSIQSCASESPTHSWHMGQTDCTGIPTDGGTYSLVYSIDVGPYATLGTAQFYQTFAAYSNSTYTDAIYFEVDPTDSGNWVTVASWQAVNGGWSTMTRAGPYDLSAYSAGSTGIARFRFRFTGGARWRVSGGNTAAGWNVDDFEVSYATYTTCTTGIAESSIKPVPDGQWVSGTPMEATKTVSNGSTVNLTWDTSCHDDPNYNLYYGVGSQIANYTLAGSQCTLGSSGSATWSAPAVPSGEHFIWWIIAGTDGAHTESSWGKDSAGNERHPAASGECGFTAKSTATSCP